MMASSTTAITLLLLTTLQLLLKPAHSFSTITMTTPPPPLALNLKVKVKPTHTTQFLTAIKSNQQSTRLTEPHNLQFVIGQDVSDPNVFYFHEEFVNCEALREHMETEHFKVYNEFVVEEDPFEEPPVICLYHLRDEEEEEKEVVTKKRGVHKESFGLNVNLYPKQSVRDDFLKVISANKKGTDTLEELALQYSYGESITVDGIVAAQEGSPNTFHFHEQYTGKDHGKEGFDAHASMPHFAAWEEFVQTDPFEKDPEVYFFKIIED